MNKTQEYSRIKASFFVYNIPPIAQRVILEALNFPEWDWFEDCDGCTAVPNYWVNKYSPSCTVHDGHWRTGRGGKVSDVIFRYLCQLYGFPKYQSKKRFIGVRLAWFGFYKWKHLLNGNKKEPTPAMIELYNYIKENKL